MVAKCVEAMRGVCDVPVTVKTRIGIDDFDSDGFLNEFVDFVADAGCSTFIVHARIAVLSGLSPKENRSVPPLNYPRVYRLKERCPHLDIILNGGVGSIDEIESHLQHVDGVMIARQAYQHPWFLAELARHVGSDAPRTRHDVVLAMRSYVEAELARGTNLKHISRHMLGLFAGQPGARAWRQHLSEHAHRPGADFAVLEQALHALPDAA
jgi:tRNA-dihydrouridine synthase A